MKFEVRKSELRLTTLLKLTTPVGDWAVSVTTAHVWNTLAEHIISTPYVDVFQSHVIFFISYDTWAMYKLVALNAVTVNATWYTGRISDWVTTNLSTSNGQQALDRWQLDSNVSSQTEHLSEQLQQHASILHQ